MEKNLDSLRHSAAHLLAAAVMEIWPKTHRTIGPSIDNGFYYDFDFAEPISEKDFNRIEQKMRSILKKWDEFEKIQVDKEQALQKIGDNPYKKELVEEFSSQGENLTFYKSGDFEDLCRGGHVQNPKEALKNFKLLSLAGAYWRGNEKNKMLTRIYGTAFFTKEELDQYLYNLEEAKKRDHKKLGRELDLFVFSDLVGAGLPLWTPKGMLMRSILDNFVWELRNKKGYQRVEIPHITKKDLYEKSGHWDKFKDQLFRITTREGHEFAMKPMNCPHHTQIFARKPHSYREMPQRYANTTMVYRDEQSGELSGLSRVRCITQDDAHVFCRKNQVKEEMLKIWDIVDEFYKPVGFKMWVRLSLSDPEHPELYLGNRADWTFAEQQLRDLAIERGVDVIEAQGEAAFYAPKLDFMANDSLGRVWQIATIQLDVNMPNRFSLYCVNERGEKEEIFMIHAAIMGSIERYISILIEHFAGNFPLWLAPVQIVVIPISQEYNNYSNKIASLFDQRKFRVENWNESISMQKRIRNAEKQKIPYMLIVGEKEKNDQSVSVRKRGQIDLGQQNIETLIENLTQEVKEKIYN